MAAMRGAGQNNGPVTAEASERAGKKAQFTGLRTQGGGLQLTQLCKKRPESLRGH